MPKQVKKIYTGKRKNAIARVMLASGSGKFFINGRKPEEYFRRKALTLIANQPLTLVNGTGKFDITINVIGGGLSGQAGAIRNGIAKALKEFNPDYKPLLKKAGYLTRDPRCVERKKYGHKGARRSFQFSKR
ncbi:MAG TPA: 30S ribosomal protein S9 [Spirochaetia bacterium]|nr:30S ribosomal protein S9 [Spirochaetia bacterium]